MAKGVKTGGRTKGVINKITKSQKERIEKVLSILDKSLEKDLKLVGPIERVKLWSTLQEFVRPKLARTELTGELNVKQTISETTNFSLKSKGK